MSGDTSSCSICVQPFDNAPTLVWETGRICAVCHEKLTRDIRTFGTAIKPVAEKPVAERPVAERQDRGKTNSQVSQAAMFLVFVVPLVFIVVIISNKNRTNSQDVVTPTPSRPAPLDHSRNLAKREAQPAIRFGRQDRSTEQGKSLSEPKPYSPKNEPEDTAHEKSIHPPPPPSPPPPSPPRRVSKTPGSRAPRRAAQQSADASRRKRPPQETKPSIGPIAPAPHRRTEKPEDKSRNSFVQSPVRRRKSGSGRLKTFNGRFQRSRRIKKAHPKVGPVMRVFSAATALKIRLIEANTLSYWEDSGVKLSELITITAEGYRDRKAQLKFITNIDELLQDQDIWRTAKKWDFIIKNKEFRELRRAVRHYLNVRA